MTACPAVTHVPLLTHGKSPSMSRTARDASCTYVHTCAAERIAIRPWVRVMLHCTRLIWWDSLVVLPGPGLATRSAPDAPCLAPPSYPPLLSMPFPGHYPFPFIHAIPVLPSASILLAGIVGAAADEWGGCNHARETWMLGCLDAWSFRPQRNRTGGVGGVWTMEGQAGHGCSVRVVGDEKRKKKKPSRNHPMEKPMMVRPRW